MPYSLVPRPAIRKSRFRKPRPPKYTLKHRKGGLFGIPIRKLEEYRRSTLTPHFQSILYRLLSQWGVRDPQKRLMAWRIIYAHRVEPWYRSQEALQEVMVQVHDARSMDTSTPHGEYAFIQRMMRIEKRRVFWEKKAQKIWEEEPIALRHVLNKAAPAVWNDFVRQLSRQL